MTSLEKASPERVEELTMLAGRMRARLELFGMVAKVWSNHGRLRVYVQDVGHVRLYDEGMEIHGGRIHRAIRDLCY